MADEEQKVGAPPPPEITIRTMKSDIKSVAAGEATPAPEKVTAKELEKISTGPVQVISETIEKGKPKSKTGVVIGVVIILFLGLAVLAYILITK